MLIVKNYDGKAVVWCGVGLCSTEEAFLIPTQLPRVRIPARRDFFSLLLSLWTVLRLHPIGFHNAVSSDIQSYVQQKGHASKGMTMEKVRYP